jgi:hypothetical protein
MRLFGLPKERVQFGQQAVEITGLEVEERPAQRDVSRRRATSNRFPSR